MSEEKYLEFMDCFTVPDISRAELITRAESRLMYPILRGLADHIFDFDVRGRILGIGVWVPVRKVTVIEVREHFKMRNFRGDPGAFIAWIVTKQPEKPWGRFVTVPEDGPQLGYTHEGDDQGGDIETLRFYELPDWNADNCFVGFREVKNP